MKIENIVIVGGGSAGWMTATTLLACYPHLNITLIESPDVATIGVGESTIGSINNWKWLSNITDDSFMPHCDATYKLSIGFENWWKKDIGFRFFYPFTNARLTPDEEYHLTTTWETKKAAYPETPWTDYADCCSSTMALVNANKMSDSNINLPDYDLDFTAAYHFDATKFGIWLRDNLCIPKGLKHQKQNVMDAKVNENGIEYLILEGNEYVFGDLFIDCTGFRSFLLDTVMGIPFNSLSDIIPNNYAWATKIPYEDPEKQIVTYTNNIAIENGWVWEIPLQHRMGSGYVYSSNFISHDNALLEFQRTLTKRGYKNVDKLDYQHIKMRIGHHEKYWVKNVLGIGLSAAFIEPLESNGLMTVHMFIHYLIYALERSNEISGWDITAFNENTKREFTNFANFVGMHYAYSQRDDTEYWKYNTNNPAYLSGDNPLMKGLGGRYVKKGFGICDVSRLGFKQRNFVDGKSIINLKNNDGVPLGVSIDAINNDRDKWNKIVKNCPSPYQYLKQKGLMTK